MFAFSKKLLAISVFYDIIKLAVNFNVLYETAQLFSGGIQNEHWLSWRYDPKARFRSHASADDRREIDMEQTKAWSILSWQRALRILTPHTYTSTVKVKSQRAKPL